MRTEGTAPCSQKMQVHCTCCKGAGGGGGDEGEDFSLPQVWHVSCPHSHDIISTRELLIKPQYFLGWSGEEGYHHGDV